MQWIRKQLPLWVTFFGALYIFIVWFIPSNLSFSVGGQEFTYAGPEVISGWSNWLLIISGMALFYGVVTLVVYGWQKIRSRQEGYGYSLVMLISLMTMVVMGLFYNVESQATATTLTHWLTGVSVGDPLFVPGFTNTNPFDWLFQRVQVPAGATMFALLAFYIASAAFRTFRAKSTEAFLLLVAGSLVMLGRVGIGEVIWTQFPNISQWLMTMPNSAGNRGIVLGLFLGKLAFAVRVIFGIERSYLGGGGGGGA